MNEQAQLDAITAELVALGYEVSRDVPGRKLNLELPAQSPLQEMRLDLVGRLRDAFPSSDERPRQLVIEVANRTRQFAQDGIAPSQARFVEDEVAVRRFKLISEGIADHLDVGFQIRFFDVSADQSASRRIRRGFGTQETMVRRVLEDQSLLARSAARDDLSRSLVVARLWSHWVRIVGNLHPGSEHRELKTADLRTIQKDLFDQQVIAMHPSRYAVLHRSLLAVVEGGDFEPRALLALEHEVRALLKWASLRYKLPMTEREPEAGSLFSRLMTAVRTSTSGKRQEELESAIGVMLFSQNTDLFAKMVASFLLALGRDPTLPDDLISDLLEQASL